MMSEEEINNDPNYPNNSYRTTNQDYHKQQQDVVTGGPTGTNIEVLIRMSRSST